MDVLSMGVAGVAAITVICFLVGQIVKASGIDNKWIPTVCGAVGAILGPAAMLTGVPDFPARDPLTAVAVGIASGLAATGANQVYKQIKDNE